MQEISAEGALSPKEKTQLFSDKCSSDENSASQGLSQDNESNGMQILHPSPQAEEATTQLSAVAQSAGGNEQKKNFVNELAPSSLAQPVGMLSPRSEHQNYERQNYEHQEGEYQELEYPEFEDQLWTPGTYDIFDPLITTEAVGAQARQYQLSDYDNVPSMNQAWGMMQPQAQNYSEGYNEEHNFASSKAQATGMSQHQAQHYSDSDGQRFGLASSMNQATGMSQHQVQQYYDNGYEDAPSQANGTIQHHAQLPYEHDYGHSSVVEEPTPSIYPLEDLEKTQNEAFEHYNDGN
jgi:hypothetical protein